MASVKKAMKTLYGSKAGKILPVLIIAGLVATASASVFVAYYGTATATAQNNDVTLVAGSDSATCTTNTPCVNVAVGPQNDFATITMNLGIQSTHVGAQPESYFTNVLKINNPTANAHSLTGVFVTSATASAASFYGQITVYMCATQTNTPATSCTNAYTIGADVSSPQTVFSGTNSLGTSGSTPAYIELVGYAGSGATAGSTSLTFNLQFTWV